MSDAPRYMDAHPRPAAEQNVSRKIEVYSPTNQSREIEQTRRLFNTILLAFGRFLSVHHK
jgi:hypothetical protein